MRQPDVAESLGSPNIVTRDSSGRETWVYDRIASTAYYSNSNFSAGAGAGGAAARGSSLVLGLLGGAFGSNTSSYTTAQKTLTVVIKFDHVGAVDTFSFHQSKF